GTGERAPGWWVRPWSGTVRARGPRIRRVPGRRRPASIAGPGPGRTRRARFRPRPGPRGRAACVGLSSCLSRRVPTSSIEPRRGHHGRAYARFHNRGCRHTSTVSFTTRGNRRPADFVAYTLSKWTDVSDMSRRNRRWLSVLASGDDLTADC